MKVDRSDGSEDSDDEDWERVVLGTSAEITGAQPAAGAKIGELFVDRAQFILSTTILRHLEQRFLF